MPMPRRRALGFNLIELMIGIAVLAILMVVGLPSLGSWIQNTHIRTSAEAIQAGLNLARAEALRRNTSVRFQLTSTVTAACALSTSGTNWVVSLSSAAGACNVAPSDTVSPFIIQARANSDGSSNAVVAASASTIIFNGLGRVTSPTSTATIDISNSTGGACATAGGGGSGGPMRCLRLTVSTGGQIRMCDPAVNDAADPRFCS